MTVAELRDEGSGAMGHLLERYAHLVSGILSCYDRVLITGTSVDIGHTRAASAHLFQKGIRIFDFEERFAKPLKEEICSAAEALAEEHGLQIEYVRRKNFRKEARIKQILAERGDHPGLVHIFSAVESCPAYRPWFDKKRQVAYLRHRDAKCLHYYFYFVHKELGLCFLRVPTWAPFRLQFYFNGHGYLARQLEKCGMGFVMEDNAFHSVEDFVGAQEIADGLSPRRLHRVFDKAVREFAPALSRLPRGFHWSITQVEYATDVIFRRKEDLAPIFENLSRSAIHAVKADDVATFLGRKLTQRYEGEAGGDFQLRIQGRRIRHHMGPASVKLYDKLGLILRIETTTYDVTFFKHYRTVEHRDGTSEKKYAPMRKTIYSLGALREVMAAANRRYLDYLSHLEDPTAGARRLDKISKPVRHNDRPYRGFNVFDPDDLALFRAIANGGFNISGFRNQDLRRAIPGTTAPQVSRALKRLRLHGLVKRIGRTYKYYLTKLGKTLVLTALKLRELVVIPALAQKPGHNQ